MPKSQHWPRNPAQLMEHLTKKHERLSAEVEALDGHLFLTPAEQSRMKKMKKEKLRTKDYMKRMKVALGASGN